MAGPSSILEDEEVKHLLSDLQLRLGRACNDQVRLLEAVRFVSFCFLLSGDGGLVISDRSIV
jgi:hypothetical protein